MADHPSNVPRLFGRFYPKDYIVAVVDERAATDQIVAALNDCGCTGDDVRVITGAQVLAEEQRYNEQRSLGERIAALLPSEEQEPVDEYVDAAREGGMFLVIHAPNVQVVQEARTILKQHGARLIRHYGDLVITEL